MLKEESRNLIKGLAFTSPWIIGFLVFTLIPVAMSFYYSLCDHNALQKPAFIGLDNYRELWNDTLFWKSLKVTFGYAAIALPAGLLVSLGLALMLNANVPGQSIFRTIMFLPSLVPLMASAMLWLWIFNTKFGLLNAVLAPIGDTFHLNEHLHSLVNWLNHSFGMGIRELSFPPQWLTDDRIALPALALMSVWGVGNTVVIFLAGLQDVPRELYEAAEIDGAKSLSRLWHVTLPMLSPVIFFNLIMAIIGTFSVFAIPYAMTSGGPDHGTYFSTMYLYDNAFTYLHMGKASAVAWVQLVIILALTGVAAYSSKRWVHYQGK